MKIAFNQETKVFSLFNLHRFSYRYNIISNLLGILYNPDNYDGRYTDYDESIESLVQDQEYQNGYNYLIPLHPNDDWSDLLNSILSQIEVSKSDIKLVGNVIDELNSYFNNHKSLLNSKSLIKNNGDSVIYKIKSGYYVETKTSKYMMIPLDTLINEISKSNRIKIPDNTEFDELVTE